ncbi:MAG: LysR family transcriptional regulator [Erysipelotrichaceae bacterium]|nr:LysR family transcriptional regulator [Erysipelotrichaceae bacterium]
MDLRNLYTFIQVAELSSFTKAADKLGYSQPTISFQIKQLEQELQTPLFERIGHTVSLTNKGKELLQYAQKIYQLMEEMNASNQKDEVLQGNLRIGMADSLCHPIIVKNFANFKEQYPNISLTISTASTSELYKLLDRNEVDVICTMDQRVYNTNYKVISEEKMHAHLVCSIDHELAKKSAISFEELLNEPFLLTEKGVSYRRIFDEALAKENYEIQPILEISNPDYICQLIESNMGLSFLPDYVTQDAIKNKKVVQLPLNNVNAELWKLIVIHKDKWVSPQLQVLLDHLAKISLMEA